MDVACDVVVLFSQSKAARSRLGSPSLRASLRRHMHDLAQTQPLASTGPHTAPHSGQHNGPAYTTQPPPQTAPTVGPLTSNPSAGGLKPDAQGQRKIRNRYAHRLCTWPRNFP